MKRFWKWRYIIPAVIVVAPFAFYLFALLAGDLVMLQWNWLLPPLFGWPSISVWQAFGLLVLCRILFGGFGGGGGRKSSGMTATERERVRQHMRRRLCSAPDEHPEPQSGNSGPSL